MMNRQLKPNSSLISLLCIVLFNRLEECCVYLFFLAIITRFQVLPEVL